MNDSQATIRINLTTKELEIKGSEEFLKTFDRQHIIRLIELMTNLGTHTGASAISSPLTHTQPAYEHFAVNEANDEVDKEYLRRFMDGYNNSFEKKQDGNNAENHTITVELETSTESESSKNLNLYALLPKNMSATNKALVVAYELQTANAKGCFSKQDLVMELKNYQPKKNIPDNFLSVHIDNGMITHEVDDIYSITLKGINFVEQYAVYFMQ